MYLFKNTYRRRSQLTLIHWGADAAAPKRTSIVTLEGLWSSMSMSLRNVIALSYWWVSAQSCSSTYERSTIGSLSLDTCYWYSGTCFFLVLFKAGDKI